MNAPAILAESAARGRLSGAASRKPVAIVDIGSNSVRLVIYETFSRTPAVVHNEKSICAIGRNMVSSGQLNTDGIRMALDALSRFRLLADAHGCEAREAVATAAARDAANGADFVRQAEKAWGGPIRILPGVEEAQLAAEGVIAGIPDADGLVADLGGGSLDMVGVKSGQTGTAMTLPFGPLRLMDQARGDAERARAMVQKELSGLGAMGALNGRSLYAVGGVWRSFARIDMEETKYPLHVLQQYEIPRARAIKLARVVARMGKKQLERMKIVSRRRAEALPYGAIVLEELLLATGIKDVVVSAYGLREGLLHAQLPPAEKAKDPLIQFAAAANQRMSRAPRHAEELRRWLAPLVDGADPFLARLLHAVSLFSDIGWRRHPDDRARGAFNQTLTAPFAGANHRMRALIATAIFHRYSGDEDFPPEIAAAQNLLDPDDDRLARVLGLGCRLAFALSASATGELRNYDLGTASGQLVLKVAPQRARISGDPVPKRLNALAAALGLEAKIESL
ncbi:MAG: hypothetical protein GC166_08175 [Alphaproteobacteria bacterium]|nr:hypothetical protein [Alphaproteobacteria bacterium]